MEIRKLNSLRGLAALIVLVSHYSNESGLLGRALGIGAGQFGVMIFFPLSSFLISYLYLDRQSGAGAIFNS
jgi:peptidoglycan/LPS O-acetylase OafA/YrhL